MLDELVILAQLCFIVMAASARTKKPQSFDQKFGLAFFPLSVLSSKHWLCVLTPASRAAWGVGSRSQNLFAEAEVRAFHVSGSAAALQTAAEELQEKMKGSKVLDCDLTHSFSCKMRCRSHWPVACLSWALLSFVCNRITPGLEV